MNYETELQELENHIADKKKGKASQVIMTLKMASENEGINNRYHLMMSRPDKVSSLAFKAYFDGCESFEKAFGVKCTGIFID